MPAALCCAVQAVIADICKRMGNGMADFIPQEASWVGRGGVGGTCLAGDRHGVHEAYVGSGWLGQRVWWGIAWHTAPWLHRRDVSTRLGCSIAFASFHPWKERQSSQALSHLCTLLHCQAN